MLRLIASIACAGLVALIAAGCGDDGGDSTPMATRLAATPLPVLTPTPDDGVPDVVREIIAAARASDAAALEALVRYRPVACTTIEGSGGPPRCLEGEAEGTPVDVVFAAVCEGFYAREGELRFSDIAFAMIRPGDPLHGVYEIDPASQLARVEPWSDAKYVVVLRHIAPADAILTYAVLADDEGIVGTTQSCGGTPEEWVEFVGLGEPIATTEAAID